jgi:farnesyl-diphosphate farnesyltransferase
MNDIATDKDWEYCNNALPKVSRTFALNIERLEGDIHKTVLIGYLIFRIADTFEDNTYRDEQEKITDLKDFSAIFKEDKDLTERLNSYETLKFRWKEKSCTKNLVENGHKVLKCYFDLPDIYRRIADPLIAEASEGMAEFQQRKLGFRGGIFQLSDINELVEYCYYVAGIVGVMLTEVFCQRERINEERSGLKAFQIHFGLALQLINIIKDYKKDITRGWCYIPNTITEKYGINLNHIENLSARQAKGVIDSLIPIIAGYLDSCLGYIKLLPLSEKSIRLFCIIPFIIGYRTLVKIVKMEGNKISRGEVSSLLKASAGYALSNKELEEDYLKVREDYFGNGYMSLPSGQFRSADFSD